MPLKNLLTSCTSNGSCVHVRACSILAPAVYIFCASALPALAFGQQLAEHTSEFAKRCREDKRGWRLT